MKFGTRNRERDLKRQTKTRQRSDTLPQHTVVPRLTPATLRPSPADSIPIGYAVRLVSVQSLAKAFSANQMAIRLFLKELGVRCVCVDGEHHYFNLAALEEALFNRLGPGHDFPAFVALYHGVRASQAVERARTAWQKGQEGPTTSPGSPTASETVPVHPPNAPEALESEQRPMPRRRSRG